MSLSERSLVLLDRLKSISDNTEIGTEQDSLIVNTFQQILSSGDTYKINEIENWLDNNLQTTLISVRILNVAHYQKAKFDAKNPLKMAHESCTCGENN